MCRIFVLIAYLIIPVFTQTTSLRFVTVIWRHGDRSPSDGTWPTDIENVESTWTQGFGELTELGMKQHQVLGKYLRKRYIEDINFLSGNYSSHEIYIRSTSYNRTLMSALSNMAGMFPLKSGTEILLNDPGWQPIPVHSQPRETDPMLWTSMPCPTADDYFNNVIMQSEEVKKIEQDNKELLELVRNQSGSKTLTLNDAWKIWDPMNCEKIHNETHKWASWVTEEIYENLTALMHLSSTFYFHHPKIQRLRGSLLFNDMAIRMEEKAYRPDKIRPKDLKYYVYSAHDTTMLMLLENLGAYNGKLPDYATAIMTELHEKKPGKFTVETWYLNETWAASDPIRLAVKGCEECSLEKYVQLAKSRVPDDWFEECGLKMPVKTGGPILVIVLGVLVGVFLSAFLVTLMMYCKVKKVRKVQVQYG